MLHTLKLTTPTDHQIFLTRDFDAPRPLLWDTMTKPELLRRWLFGPPGWTMTTCEDDARVGGHFRWSWRGPEGQSFSLLGTYREIAPPVAGGHGGIIVRTETFEPMCHPVASETLARLELKELPDQPKRTRLSITLSYASKEARDGAIASGMDQGMSAGYDRLDEMITSGELLAS